MPINKKLQRKRTSVHQHMQIIVGRTLDRASVAVEEIVTDLIVCFVYLSMLCRVTLTPQTSHLIN